MKAREIKPGIYWVGAVDWDRRLFDELIPLPDGTSYKQFDLATVDIGKLAMALVDAATLVVGVPTTLVGPHPMVAYAVFLANALRPKTRFASIIGSYGWGSQAKEQIISMIPNLKVELLEPVMVKGLPREEDFKALDTLASTIAEKHRSLSQATA
jgi:flavorubredoxin